MHLGVKKGHYQNLLERTYQALIIQYLALDENVIENSLFGFWKGADIQQVIWGGERSNMLFSAEACNTELPTPNLFCSFILLPQKRLHLAARDVFQYYNRLRVPSFLISFFGLLSVASTSVNTNLRCAFVVPCFTCLPMGASFAVAVGKAVTQAVLIRE